ncbi:MAG: iron-containing alcohol dehydrogenase [Spirochaetota bacterium]
MENFIFQNRTKIIFGKDTETEVGGETGLIGKKVLLHYGTGSIKKTGLYDRVLTSLKESGIDVVELGGVKPNPRLSLVHEGIRICKDQKIDCILAVGGGSVIDSAKAIGVGYYHDGDVWDFYDYKTAPEKMLPLGVVLTIPAAGSETSSSSVISNEEKQLKRGLTAACMRPDFCILNPELTYTLPDYQTACGISDMLAHTMERYFTPTKNVDLTDRLCEAVMVSIINQAYKVFENPKDYAARAEIMWAGTVAHNDLTGTGRAQDWASHGMEHEISALTDVAHGAGLAIDFPAWMKYVYKTDIGRFLQFAKRVFGMEENKSDPESTVMKAIEALENFYRDIKMPVRLSEIGFDESQIDIMADKATFNNTQTIGGFKKLTRDDVKAIYTLAL